MVSTQDSESCDPSSNLGRTCKQFCMQLSGFFFLEGDKIKLKLLTPFLRDYFTPLPLLCDNPVLHDVMRSTSLIASRHKNEKMDAAPIFPKKFITVQIRFSALKIAPSEASTFHKSHDELLVINLYHNSLLPFLQVGKMTTSDFGAYFSESLL